MADEVTVASEAKPEEVTEQKAQTIGEIINEKPEKQEPKAVPEAAFLELKNANKELKRELRALQSKIEEGATRVEVSDSIDAIGDEFNVDKKFLAKLATVIRKEAEQEAENKVSAKLKPYEERERSEKIRKIFDGAFNAAMEELDDYKGIVSKDAIFELSLNPANSGLTLQKLIEKTYSGAISGKRSIETTTARSSSVPSGQLDTERVQRDSDYLSEVLSNPSLKKQWDEYKTDIARRA